MRKAYTITTGKAAILEFTRAMRDYTGDLSPVLGVFSDCPAPVVRNGDDGVRELTMMRWGMPSPQSVQQEQIIDGGVTEIIDVASPHWQSWLGPANRCVAPFNSFAEYRSTVDDKKVPVWFARDRTRPLMLFAGIWTNWTGVRKTREGEVSADFYAVLTYEPKGLAASIFPETMPMILTEPDEIDIWMRADWSEASALQRPPPGSMLQTIAGGKRSTASARDRESG